MKDLAPEEISSLLNRIAQGDDKAVAHIFRYYHAPLYRFICLRHVPAVDAEEIAQDVLLEVACKPGAFKGRSRFSTWLCGIAKFKVLDYHRKNGSQPLQEALDDVNSTQVEPHHADVLSSLVESRDWEAMLTCVYKLPEDLRDTVLAAIFEQDSLEDAAAHLGCPVGTVKSRLFHARSRLSACIQRWLKGDRDDA